MISDLDMDEEVEHSIPIWRMGISIFFLVIVMLGTSTLLCFTNNQCRFTNLLEYSFINAISSLLSLHLFVAFGIYCLTAEKAYIACRVQMSFAVLVYIMVVITIFIFPFTNFERFWAHIVMLSMIFIWMCTVVWSLLKYYKYKISIKRHIVKIQFGVAIIFGGFTIAYIFYRPIEFGCYSTILLFLVLSIIHICEIKIKILTR